MHTEGQMVPEGIVLREYKEDLPQQHNKKRLKYEACRSEVCYC